jgi:hypothetical protein
MTPCMCRRVSTRLGFEDAFYYHTLSELSGL